ncbi:hypothetical protein KXV68_003423 [Aspergillus fumigatus]|uniref:Uncharacterized protein n=1 Tax=Aspergillus fumigatus (strain ATCC MYA-4609 / CBS 101355 / FGSC A1100 / Af293) TaxID=330879 RepID=Q4WP33_ASPFU|nr:hypothetical protein AFUA_4G07860 [Aspergillus fumigatus Af293]KAF4269676.1 hypothetical protein CNMCM8714_007670 [Aspergillus fumigatus]KMK54531.1 hypothetical protein Y699_06175 [Aspergillus fumigatus Z5]EAL90001.1 hypothetical protein AFUA_4G07860 [Aspergillus fumigatus Af293]KAF4274776.1 hypothetical protein CNMCM8812_004143 [Aspergillus fumigatus]KAH1302945.1 hypothetical protein KXX11_002528 [Aspergillus fumigatus]
MDPDSDSTRDTQQPPEMTSRMQQAEGQGRDGTRATGSSTNTADMYSTTTSSLADLGNHISNMAGTTMAEIRNKASAVSAKDVVREVRDTAYSITMGNKQAEESTGTGVEDCDPQEARRIDELPKERIVEFLQERHKSNAVHPSKQQ